MTIVSSTDRRQLRGPGQQRRRRRGRVRRWGASAGGVLITNSLLFGNADGGTTPAPQLLRWPDRLTRSQHHRGPRGCDIALEPTDLDGAATLEPLADNGGPTMTYALPKNSVAIGHGPTGDVACKGTDQRGVPRTGGCDTGAYQLEHCEGAVINVVGHPGADSSRIGRSRRHPRHGRPDRVEAAADQIGSGWCRRRQPLRWHRHGRARRGRWQRPVGRRARQGPCAGGPGKDRKVSC